MADDEKKLKVTIQYQVDPKGIGDAQGQNRKIQQGADEIDKGARKAGAGMKELEKSAQSMQKLGVYMSAAGAAISAGMLKGINTYIQSVGSSETASRSWLQANQSIEESTVRIGRVLTSAALPALQQLSGLVNDIAGFIEKNPALAKLLLGGAVGLTAGGAAIAGAGTLAAGAAGATGMLGAAGATGAAGAVGLAGAAAVPIAAAAVVGTGAGLAWGTILTPVVKGVDDWLKSKGLPSFSSIAYGAGQLVGGALGKSNLGQTLKAGGVFDQKANDAANAGPNLGGYTPQQIIAANQYYRQEEEASRQHNIQLQMAQRDYQIQETHATEDFNKTKTRAMRDFSISERNTEQDYYRQRLLSARDFGIQVTRTEQDYQRSRSRETQDHQFDLFQIALSGDAMQYYLSQRQYNIQRSREEEDHNVQVSRASQDFALSQADQEKEYAIERARTLEQFKIQQVDAQADFDLQRQRAQVAYDLQIKDLNFQYDEQARQRKQAITDALNDMSDGTTKAGVLFGQFTTGMIANMQTLVDNAAKMTDYLQTIGNPTIPSHAAGGYTQYGKAMLHSGEWVATAQTVKGLEAAVSGRLTQDNVMAAIARGGKGGSGSGVSVTYTDNRTFSADVPKSVRDEIKNETTEAIFNAIDKAIA